MIEELEPGPGRSSTRGLLALAALGFPLLLAACASGGGSAPPKKETRLTRLAPVSGELRASWVVRSDIKTPAGVARVLREAESCGLNTLFVQVRGRGDSWFDTLREPRAAGIPAGFDPLQALIEGGHRRGIRIHAWVNVSLIWNPNRPHPDPTHPARQHPEWLSVPAALLARQASLSRESRLRALEDYQRANAKILEGVYGNLGHPGYRQHLFDLLAELAERYPVEGIHLDYIRDPGPLWGVEEGDVRRLARRLGVAAPEAGVSTLRFLRKHDEAWGVLRRQAISGFVRTLRRRLRRIDPALLLTAAVFPDPDEAHAAKQQAWPSWLREGLLDAACPMNYAAERAPWEERVHKAQRAARGRPLWMGIGAWRLDPRETAARVRWLRRQSGVEGVLLFSHSGLRERRAFEKLQSSVFASPGS